MDKGRLSERDICTKFITPAILRAGWQQHEFREEVTLTDGRVMVRGTLAARVRDALAKGGPKRADYVLYVMGNIPIVVIEVKHAGFPLGHGMQQAHRDYSGFSGGVAVGIYSDRIEIWNSGHFPEGLKPGDLNKNHPSLPTNPDIAHVFYLRGLMERIGRGGQLIINACRDHGLPPPRWADRPTGVTLTIFGRRGRRAALWTANPRQQAMLLQISCGDLIRPGDYHQRFASEVSDRQARRDLSELEEAGLLVRIGRGAATVYQRTNRTWEDGKRT